jgi:hypothetical protein
MIKINRADQQLLKVGFDKLYLNQRQFAKSEMIRNVLVQVALVEKVLDQIVPDFSDQVSDVLIGPSGHYRGFFLHISKVRLVFFKDVFGETLERRKTGGPAKDLIQQRINPVVSKPKKSRNDIRFSWLLHKVVAELFLPRPQVEPESVMQLIPGKADMHLGEVPEGGGRCGFHYLNKVV